MPYPMAMRRRSVPHSPVCRLRTRRMLSSYLKIRREAAKPVEVFESARVDRMLRSGQSFDAERYLDRFLPPIAFSKRSPLCMLLLVHIRIFRILSNVAAGGPSGARMAALFANPMEYLLESAYSVHLHKTIARMHADQTRASMLWQKIQPGALDKIMDMIARCPELQGEGRMPRKRPLLWDAAPNGLRQCPSRCRNPTNHAPSNVLIGTFLRKRLLLVQGKTHAVLSGNASSQSAVPHTIKQSVPQPALLPEGVSHSPVVHHIPHIVVSPAKTLASTHHQLLIQRPMVNVEAPVF